MDYSHFYVGFQSILFFQVFLMLLQALVNQRKEYYYYIFYILLLMIYCHAMWTTYGNGLNNLKYNDFVKPLMDKPVVILSFFMYFRFARNFLEVPLNFKNLNKKIILMEYVFLAYALCEVILIILLGDVALNEFIYRIFALLSTGVCALCLIALVWWKKPPLNYFMIAGSCSILFGSVLSLLLIIFNPVLPFPVITIFPFFVLVEISVFTTGLVYKSKIIAKQKLLSEKKLLEESLLKNELQSSIYNLRNKIAGDLHDDIGSTLGSLGVFAEAGKKSLDSGAMDKANYAFEKIYLLATESLKNLREMVWVITPGKEKWKDLADKMEDYGKGLLQSKNILFNFDNQVDEKYSLSVVQRRNLFLIFKESIHNIIKHSNARHVEIKAHLSSEGNFTFIVKDDGTGNKDDLSSNGYGLKSILLRTRELDGSLVLENNERSGIIIKLEFPIHYQFLPHGLHSFNHL